MFKKLFKSNKEKEVKATKNAKVEKLNAKELNTVTGGAYEPYVTIKGVPPHK